ncbi:MAG: FAD-dependent oxidoreductase [Steroidobacteraceae bacterium]
MARAQGRALARADWDLIVVGAGTAGLPAALFAAHRGARVLLLEKAAQTGGTLWFSGGRMSAAGTRLQASTGSECICRWGQGLIRCRRGRGAWRSAARCSVRIGPGCSIAVCGLLVYRPPRVDGRQDGRTYACCIR